MSYEKVVAVYDTEANANAALKSLVSAGYLTDDISVIRSEAVKAGLYEPGVWQHLFGRDLDPHEAAVLSRSFKASVIVSVRVPQSEAAKVVGLLDSHKPVDVLDRAKAYGLVGATPPEAPKIPASPKRTGEETLRVAEEQMNVGKRVVQAGLTRVRRYVIEKPVESNVTLHEEHAEVMRRVISDPNYMKDIDWSDETIEVTETVEEPVVGKTAHITEEVVIRRQGSDRMQTVHDTVRRQQVEVDHLPVGAGTKK